MKVAFDDKKFDIDEILFSFLITNLLLLVFINEGQLLVEFAISVFCSVRIIMMMHGDKYITGKVLISVCFFAYLTFITVLQGFDFTYYTDNFKLVYRPLVVFLYLSTLLLQKPNVIKKILEKNYLFFNVYYSVNLVYLLYQSTTSIFYDNITGFLGIYGTHRLTAFTTFLVLLNISLILNSKIKRKWILLVYTLYIAVSTFIVSNINDNTAVFIFLPLSVLLYLFCSGRISPKMLLSVAAIGVLFILLFSQMMKNEEILYFLESRLFNKIEGMMNVFDGESIEEERMVYVEYAFEKLNGAACGVGMGSIKIIGDPTISSLDILLRNWGMSNMASFISIGGIAFLILYIIAYVIFIAYPHSGVRIYIAFFVLLFVLVYYGQPLTSIPMITAVWMMLYPFLSNRNFKIYQNEGEI